MAGFIAKQPNGLYCRYSSVVDNITHYNMTEEDYIELCVERAKEEAREILKHAVPFDRVVSALYPDTKRDLRRMIMNFDSQICTTKEQSERLLALGVKKETADMCWNKLTLHGTPVTYPSQDVWLNYSITSDSHFPAWSLHRLLCFLPTEYIADIDFQYIMQDFIFRSQNMYDDVINCIKALIKDGYFYQEYLEE